ncbi:MAG TPA: PorP/SprF family type IX secretion system membrane protein [Saprospiraceae bacterium]|mgnify:FL=1|jgi:type IX secretion system PorP/SprF family membrane protein|nr:PorP/SprF family type IX secretion system membrane protein [Saprospiraceae bacterium]HPB53466.1 PorP/SprF family type IX secretion system membrane protein [Saprospiraceae bacterium]HQP77009.1 PorP/SprF family type IX secretion system membrane protein [Saprospiraceae bacterium]HRN34336.1 PorP/SprF family type IX secretion system membrane protein [Saprospiraceae bacterium]HRP84196.1 PorP/SprF family type IX secretion system membrane protein [Saprospiraceae bacterium]
MKLPVTFGFLTTCILFNLVIFSSECQAQQLPLFTQYREVQGLINPASISHDYFLEKYNANLGITYRNQWTDINGHPVTAAIKADYIVVPANSSFSLLTGAYYLSDRAGLTNRQSAYVRLGSIYSQNPSESGFGLGINIGQVWNSFNFGEVKLTDPQDINIDKVSNFNYLDLGIGTYYYKKLKSGPLKNDQFYVGVSVPQIFNQDYVIKNGTNEFVVKRVPHIYAHAGYYKTMSETMYIAGSFWYRYVHGGGSIADVNARIYLFDKLWFGAGASTAGTLHVEAGTILGKYFNFNDKFNLKIGYASDFNLGYLAKNLGLSHELNLILFLDTVN